MVEIKKIGGSDERAEVSEKIAKIICYTKPGDGKDDESLGGFVAYASMLPVKWSNKNFTVPADQILNAPFTVEGGVCPQCVGLGKVDWVSLLSTGLKICPTCKGEGKLPDITKTLWEWAKLGIGTNVVK